MSGSLRREANNTPNLINLWLGTPADNSGTELFINQQSAIDFQNNHTDATVVAGLGITIQNKNSEDVTRVDAIGDSSFSVSGAQPPRSDFS